MSESATEPSTIIAPNLIQVWRFLIALRLEHKKSYMTAGRLLVSVSGQVIVRQNFVGHIMALDTAESGLMNLANEVTDVSDRVKRGLKRDELALLETQCKAFLEHVAREYPEYAAIVWKKP